MKESPASTVGTSVIIGSEPQVFVSDLDAASAFYVHKLGFKVVLSYGEPPFYAQIARDEGRLNLRKVSGPVFDRGFRSREADALSATLRSTTPSRSLWSFRRRASSSTRH